MGFAERMTRLRHELAGPRSSLAEFAALLDVSRQNLQRWEDPARQLRPRGGIDWLASTLVRLGAVRSRGLDARARRRSSDPHDLAVAGDAHGPRRLADNALGDAHDHAAAEALALDHEKSPLCPEPRQCGENHRRSSLRLASLTPSPSPRAPFALW